MSSYPRVSGLRLKDSETFVSPYPVSDEVKGACSVYYPFYLALWDEPVYYQCHIIVWYMQHRVSVRQRLSSISTVRSESLEDSLGVLKAIDTTHSSYISSDSEESWVPIA